MNSGHIEIAVKKIEIIRDQRDDNAAINIARRGVESWGEVMHPYAAPTLTAS
jgi:hypothetical protein